MAFLLNAFIRLGSVSLQSLHIRPGPVLFPLHPYSHMYSSSSSYSSSSFYMPTDPYCWTDHRYNNNTYPSPLDDVWSLSFEFSPLVFPSLPSPWSASQGKIGSQTMPRLTAFDFPPSPSDTCSSISTDISPSPEPMTTRVVCDVPLLAPRPLPYHSPTFLQFDLPDSDEDLSHPPYTHRPPKRKRDDDDHHPQESLRLKRHAGVDRWAARVHRQAWCGSLPTQGHSHVYPGTRRHRLR